MRTEPRSARTPHLLDEDRADFERTLDEALRTEEYRPDPADTGARLDTEQLRTMALSATSAIAACATIEYERYVRLRATLRTPTGPSSTTPGQQDPGTNDEERRRTSAAAAGRAKRSVVVRSHQRSSTGIGLTGVLATLAPVLFGVAAVVFLLTGYILRGLEPGQAVAKPMISVGWVFAGLTGAAFLVAVGGLVSTALRNTPEAQRAAEEYELTQEVDRAREAWRRALREHGVVPFLREALRDPAADTVRESRSPTLGYSRADFTGPEEAPPPSPHPHFVSPDFTSPDYGGSDSRPD